MKLPRFILLSWLALGLLASAHAATETYTIDPVHSSVGFTVRHVFSKVPGSFTKFSGTIVVDHANPAANTVNATIEIGSVNTASAKRDGHLQAPEFFDAAKAGGFSADRMDHAFGRFINTGLSIRRERRRRQ